MNMKNRLASGLAIIVTLLPAAALAHTGTGAHLDMVRGFLHPLTGLDHILAMVAVGVFAAELGGRSIWSVPVAFVLAMVAGGCAGHFGAPLPMVEQGIALSVIAMGMAVALGTKLPMAPAMALVAVFAVFHGNAHGLEGVGAGSFVGYALGFVVATSLLHLAGISLGLILDRFGGKVSVNAKRLIGAAGTVAGAAILMG